MGLTIGVHVCPPTLMCILVVAHQAVCTRIDGDVCVEGHTGLMMILCAHAHGAAFVQLSTPHTVTSNQIKHGGNCGAFARRIRVARMCVIRSHVLFTTCFGAWYVLKAFGGAPYACFVRDKATSMLLQQQQQHWACHKHTKPDQQIQHTHIRACAHRVHRGGNGAHPRQRQTRPNHIHKKAS